MRHLDLKAGPPSRLGNQQQRIEMRLNANFMSGDLVGAAAGMFGFGGSQAVGRFEPRALAATSGGPASEFPLVVFEIIVDAIQFTAQIIFLPCANGGQFGSHFSVQRRSQDCSPASRIWRRPRWGYGGF